MAQAQGWYLMAVERYFWNQATKYKPDSAALSLANAWTVKWIRIMIKQCRIDSEGEHSDAQGHGQYFIELIFVNIFSEGTYLSRRYFKRGENDPRSSHWLTSLGRRSKCPNLLNLKERKRGWEEHYDSLQIHVVVDAVKLQVGLWVIKTPVDMFKSATMSMRPRGVMLGMWQIYVFSDSVSWRG